MATYIITVEATIIDELRIEADSYDEAMDEAERQLDIEPYDYYMAKVSEVIGEWKSF